MGIGGISIWQLLIILLIVVLLFGTKKLRSLGGDLGSAIKNFKDSMQEGRDEVEESNVIEHDSKNTTPGQQRQKDNDKSPH